MDYLTSCDLKLAAKLAPILVASYIELQLFLTNCMWGLGFSPGRPNYAKYCYTKEASLRKYNFI